MPIEKITEVMLLETHNDVTGRYLTYFGRMIAERAHSIRLNIRKMVINILKQIDTEYGTDSRGFDSAGLQKMLDEARAANLPNRIVEIEAALSSRIASTEPAHTDDYREFYRPLQVLQKVFLKAFKNRTIVPGAAKRLFSRIPYRNLSEKYDWDSRYGSKFDIESTIQKAAEMLKEEMITESIDAAMRSYTLDPHNDDRLPGIEVIPALRKIAEQIFREDLR